MGQLLQRMAKGMPEVEQRPLSLLRFVGGDDARLRRAADRDRFGPGWPASEHFAPVRFQKLEKAAVANEPDSMTSAKPARKSRPLRESRHVVSASTSDG